MPLYEYECDACGRRFELIRKFSDPPLESCTVCGSGPIRRLQSSPAFQFKGSGWYATDYAGKGKGDTPAADKPAEGKADGASSSDTPAKAGTEATPATKSDAGTTPTSSTTSESKPRT